MAPIKAYAALARTPLNFVTRSTSPTPILCDEKKSSIIPSPPVAPPWYPRSRIEHRGTFSKPLSPLNPRMHSDFAAFQPHWLSSIRSCLRLLIIVLSGTVAGILVHTLQIYRGNRYLDLRKGELPVVWPARTNLAPTLVLFIIATLNFLASIAILTMSFKKSFRRPIRSRDMYRIVAGSFGVILWAVALVVFHLLDKASKASLGRYSCTNRNLMSNGRFQYRAVCSEQGIAFYVAVAAASAEFLTLLTLAISAIISAKRPSLIRDEKRRLEKRSMSMA